MGQKIKLTKKKAKKIMEAPGEIRGFAIKANWDYILKERGYEGIRKMEEELARLGYPLRYKEIKRVKFYPVGHDALIHLILIELFSFTKENFYEMGGEGPKSSLIFKIIMKYLPSLKTTVRQMAQVWQRYYTIGSIEIVEINETEKRIVLRIKDFSFPYTKMVCYGIGGYIAKVGQIVLGRKTVCQETKCIFEGDPYHEFLITW